MKVIPRVVGVRVPTPSTLPRTILLLLVVVDVEIVVPIPAHLEASGHLVRIVVAGHFDAGVQVPRLDDRHRLEGAMADESRP
jgi:hypothetical protein